MTLLGVEDVEHWERQGLLASVDELCNNYYKRTSHNCDFNDSATGCLRLLFPITCIRMTPFVW
jgi:hypothetical protein